MIRRAESLMRARKVSRLRCPERIASRRHRDIDVSRSFSNLSRGPQLMQPRRGCNAMTISFIVYMTERTCRETSKRTVGRASIPYRPRRLFCAAWRICGRREMVAQALRRRPADDMAWGGQLGRAGPDAGRRPTAQGECSKEGTETARRRGAPVAAIDGAPRDTGSLYRPRLRNGVI